MDARKLTLDKVLYQHFPGEDVLKSPEDRFERQHKLRTATARTNMNHETISLFVQLASGELVEISSDLIEVQDDYVELRGGIGIPLKAIVDVGV
jgi:hypothetical protein